MSKPEENNASKVLRGAWEVANLTCHDLAAVVTELNAAYLVEKESVFS